MSKLTALEVQRSRYVFQRNQLQNFRRGLATEEAYFRMLQGLDPDPTAVMQCHKIPGIGITPPARLLKVWKCGVGHLDNIRTSSFFFSTTGQPSDSGGIVRLLEANQKRKAINAYINGTATTSGTGMGIGILFEDGPTIFTRILLMGSSTGALTQYFARAYTFNLIGSGLQVNPSVHNLFPCPTSPITLVIALPRNTPNPTVVVQEQYA